MFSTAQFRVFTTEPEARTLARPRNLLRQGNRAAAEGAYQEVLHADPDLKAAWAEYFQLLRAEGRFDDALALAGRASERFAGQAFGLALQGAAWIELGHFREALQVLEKAAEQDPNLGMVWHEMGYAAHRLGQPGPALLALDRAFALDPRSGTLHLRGKILRNSGKYLAAEVAFSGAAESAEFPEQRSEAEKQIHITHRFASLAKKPAELSRTQRWFGETGGAVLVTEAETPAPCDEEILQVLPHLAADLEWRFDAVLATCSWTGWPALAGALGVPLIAHWPGEGVPLVVSRRPVTGGEAWITALARVQATRTGLTLTLEQPEAPAGADLAGRLAGMTTGALDLPFAVQCLTHPDGKLADRRLRP